MSDTKFFPPGKLEDPDAAWWERILARFFSREEIPARSTNDLYMRRFIIAGAHEYSRILTKMKRRLYLHVFYRSDEDPDPHCHPNDFRTVVLANGYWDETWSCVSDGQRHYRTVMGRTKMTRFSFGFRKAEHIHRARLLDPTKRTVTLVLFEPKRRDWYFYTKLGPIVSDEYDGPGRMS